MDERLSLEEVEDLSRDVLRRAGAIAETADAVARSVRAAERDGMRASGLGALPDLVTAMRAGRIDGAARASVEQSAPGILRADGGGGFAQVALEAALPGLAEAARSNGIALLAVHRAGGCESVLPYAESLADQGLLALGLASSPAAATGGPQLGRNPIAFAAPQAGSGPGLLVEFDSGGEASETVLPTVAHDAAGATVTVSGPTAGTAGGTVAARDRSLVLLVEVLTACLAGTPLGRETDPADMPVGGPLETGFSMIAIDPGPSSGGGFTARLEALAWAFAQDARAPLPDAARREARHRADAEGVAVPAALLENIINA